MKHNSPFRNYLCTIGSSIAKPLNSFLIFVTLNHSYLHCTRIECVQKSSYYIKPKSILVVSDVVSGFLYLIFSIDFFFTEKFHHSISNKIQTLSISDADTRSLCHSLFFIIFFLQIIYSA